MDFNSMKANNVNDGFVLEVINKAYEKVEDILVETATKFEEEDEPVFTFEETQRIIMCRMFEAMMSIVDGIADLSHAITIGAVEHLEEEMGLTDEEVLDMEEDKMEEALKPYLDLQHTYADFNNNQIKDMLFETAKHILTPPDLMLLYLGF